MSSEFYNFSLKQTVNQWLCITLISVWCFGMVMYWFNNKSDILESKLAYQQVALQGVTGSR